MIFKHPTDYDIYGVALQTNRVLTEEVLMQAFKISPGEVFTTRASGSLLYFNWLLLYANPSHLFWLAASQDPTPCTESPFFERTVRSI